MVRGEDPFDATKVITAFAVWSETARGVIRTVLAAATVAAGVTAVVAQSNPLSQRKSLMKENGRHLAALTPLGESVPVARLARIPCIEEESLNYRSIAFIYGITPAPRLAVTPKHLVA
jgi:hypothetical protein